MTNCSMTCITEPSQTNETQFQPQAAQIERKVERNQGARGKAKTASLRLTREEDEEWRLKDEGVCSGDVRKFAHWRSPSSEVAAVCFQAES